MRMPPCPAVTEGTCAKTCNLEARPRERRSLKELGLKGLKRLGLKGLGLKGFEAAHPSPARNEWAIGRLHPANPKAKGAPSAAFGRAARCGPRATTDTPVLVQLAAAEAAPRDRAEVAEAAPRDRAEVAAVTVAAVVGADRSERQP